MPDQAFGFGTPFAEQIAFLRAKLNLPTERWDDITRAAHDRAFIVAGAAKADLLTDLRGAVDQAVQGGSLGQFRKDFDRIVATRGWTGWTGEGSAAGVAWRTKVIYQTNLLTSHAAGRYRQLTDPDTLDSHPYWQYVHSDSVLHPRPLHQSWDGLTLRHDHPFWAEHFPPNGWGCRCRIRARARPPAGAATEPPAGWDAPDPKTGAPVGIDKGFDYAPGASADVPLRQMVQDKLITYPPAISKALAADINRYIEARQGAAEFVRQALADGAVEHPLWLGFVADPATLNAAAGVDTTGYLITVPGDRPRHVRNSHEHDGDGQRMAEPQDYEHLASVLNQADSIRAGDTSRHGNSTVVAVKRIGVEIFRAVFEVLPGKKNRAMALLSLVIKTR